MNTTTSDPTENEWMEWIELQRSATTVWFGGSPARAVAMLDEFLKMDHPRAIVRQVIGYRGSIQEDAGDLEAAKHDFLSALEISEDSDFERYTLEEALAAVEERLGDDEAAESWCLKALETAVADGTTSGMGCLRRLLRLRGGWNLSEVEHRLVEKMVVQDWHRIGMEGEPDLRDLPATIAKLLTTSRGSRSQGRL